MRDITYPPIILTAKTVFRVLGQKFDIQGVEHIPRQGGALMAFNHVGYLDFIYGGFPAHLAGRRVVRFMAKKEVFDNPVGGPVMRSMHHIPVDRGDGIASYHQAVDYLREGELVGIFPEATISRAMELKEFKTGAVRIASAAGVPIIPVTLFGTQRIFTKGHPKDFSRGRSITITVGEPMPVSGADPVTETAELHARMSKMLDETIQRHPAAERPAGAWWVPASHGGSAPTLEEAAAIDAEERRARARRKAAKAAEKRQGSTDS
ncbi:lysophospholipid acyltransferase family protein [Nocardioides campestrisoli]|uniref:lysophospholipid acyltransferase family protein n=1 Tax=Nocardioides campestrisoli TaxID=2736757 RepID=UPI00163DC9A3|nr:lysophospholipid acyltransferase family protein [Nocardioides campestrisoli]